MKKLILFVTILVCTSQSLLAQLTYVPDDNFEQALIDLGLDAVLDNYVSSILVGLTGSLDISGKNINDLTGIEDFNFLVALDVSNNNLTSLDLSNNGGLRVVNVANNNLNSFRIDNGNNTDFVSYNSTGNSNLKCIRVDNEVYSIANWANIDAHAGFSHFNCSLLTYVPDDNFEQELISQNHDTTINNHVLTSSINSLTTLDVGSENIDDLTGIENFISLTSLDADYNNLTTINVANLSNLEELYVNDNELTTIDISNLNNLETIRGFRNNLISVTTGNHPSLINLELHENSIASIDLSNMPVLNTAYLRTNNLTSINTANNLVLETLSIQENNAALTSLDFSNNPTLKSLNCGKGNLSNLNISQNFALTNIWCHESLLTQLDLSHLTSLVGVSLKDNTQLDFLDVKNGNNMNFNYFLATGSPSLSCINVDNLTYATNNWNTFIDGTSSFNEHCYETYVPDDNFENYLETHDASGNTVSVGNASSMGNGIANDDYVTTDNINTVTSLTVSALSIADLTGIEDFIALTNLNCFNNSISAIDVTNNTQLQYLNCSKNTLTALDVTLNIALTELRCGENTISTLNVTQNTLLEKLYCYENSLTNLNVTQNILLENFDCNSNQITSIDASNCLLLEEFNCSDNNVSSLNIKNGNNTNILIFEIQGNPNLNCAQVDNAMYSNTNWTNKDVQTIYNDANCDISIISPKVFLQGAALNPNTGEETLMRDDLRVAGIISTTSPYADMLSINSTVLNTTGTDAIIDWVWVEVRDVTDNTIVLDATSALLQRDGDVVAIDGISDLGFNQVSGNYYIAIKHRNHLGIMTANTMALSVVTTSVDFTDGNNQITYGSNAQTTFGMPADTVAMWSGNANGDTVVQYSGTNPDTPDILSEILNDAGNFLNFPTYAVSGYNVNDVNMDGNTQYSGTNPDTPFILQNVLAHPGNFLNFSTYDIIEQLPENLNP